ncbi:MAG: flavodoxin family protein [Candidatus Cloacimonetes bacterium]|nr:flavodoxin family protein [Candidatus Cloacimonadota bacterium]MCF7813603.1 flavodoxin family protein [Candidatus Cloacimonadota bacterium]MCF7867919.1 flavodoxin family protein [Candidatus Cloacimonadota bacterium]MCF7882888.1 flavodoxin family protein [Candidatus Cloacimonadota bacterium]
MESTLKILVICQSIHQRNTRKVAEVFSEILKAEVKKPSEIDTSEIRNYDLIGFGSGIYNGYHHPSLFGMIDNLSESNKQKAFIFSTSTIFINKMHQKLRNRLVQKGFEITGEFNCKGRMTYSFTKFCFGGLNKSRPNKKDLGKARKFAENLIK